MEALGDHAPDIQRARAAMFAAVAATLGDFGELWTANAGRAELALPAPPEWLIVPATLAGAIGIPLYVLGYFARAQSLAALNVAHVVFFASVAARGRGAPALQWTRGRPA